ncbi:Hypothetical_protein [Hexamita inflata]|uniref:Hypothetical_protein n=1 Tax=Hexamita inflata TaxID=28002 RepID=A0AA86QCQ9_9EUKA|nr:Hypothetical protein HINF_LOCUS21868 [Hexamita inflata]CAI9950629.1 Hypothetical protein HINF_LOCUS38274 [Hexamita inflata]CAI9951988.1 Hypothetical protein HINF_LOCUS39633 [Hexamita inflata]
MMSLTAKQKSGMFKQVESKLNITYSKIYNYIRYTWSKQFYYDIEQYQNEIILLTEQFTHNLLDGRQNIDKIKVQVWQMLQKQYEAYYFHPETFYNLVAYRTQKIINQYKKQPINLIIFDKVDDEIQMCIYEQSYQIGNIDGIYDLIRQQCSYVDCDDCIVELALL